PRTGEPTGVLKEAAMQLVSRHVPKPTRAELTNALRRSMEEAHRNGITSIQNASGNSEEFEVYAEARRDNDLEVRVYSALTASGPLDQPAIDGLDAFLKQYPDDPLFKTGAIEITLDGAVESRTAAMLESYVSDDEAGTPALDRDMLNR